MPVEKEIVRDLIIGKLSQHYWVEQNHFVKGQHRDTILPICIMSEAGTPCLAIRIRLRPPGQQQYTEKPNKRLKRWEELTGNHVVTIWSRDDANRIVQIVNRVFKA